PRRGQTSCPSAAARSPRSRSVSLSWPRRACASCSAKAVSSCRRGASAPRLAAASARARRPNVPTAAARCPHTDATPPPGRLAAREHAVARPGFVPDRARYPPDRRRGVLQGFQPVAERGADIGDPSFPGIEPEAFLGLGQGAIYVPDLAADRARLGEPLASSG